MWYTLGENHRYYQHGIDVGPILVLAQKLTEEEKNAPIPKFSSARLFMWSFRCAICRCYQVARRGQRESWIFSNPQLVAINCDLNNEREETLLRLAARLQPGRVVKSLSHWGNRYHSPLHAQQRHLGHIAGNWHQIQKIVCCLMLYRDSTGCFNGNYKKNFWWTNLIILVANLWCIMTSV